MLGFGIKVIKCKVYYAHQKNRNVLLLNYNRIHKVDIHMDVTIILIILGSRKNNELFFESIIYITIIIIYIINESYSKTINIYLSCLKIVLVLIFN
jgi:hypothetical protein